MSIHIGKKIKEELYKQELSVSTFAKKINRSRNVVYDIFKRQSIDTALLNSIGLILHVNFFALYAEHKGYKKEKILEEEAQEYKTVNEQLRLQEQQLHSKQEEIDHLKKLVALLEEKNRELVRLNKRK